MYKILIVEDDMVIAKGLASHLQQWGYDAVYVEDFKMLRTSFWSVILSLSFWM